MALKLGVNIDHVATLREARYRGRESRQGEYTKEFAQRLEAWTGVPVKFWDERLTSVEAERVLKQSGISIEKRARAVDRLAAVILLESYLDSQCSE